MSDPEEKLDKVDTNNLDKGPAAPPEEEGSSGTETSSSESYSGKITVDIGEDLAQKARSAVYYTPGLRLYDLAKEGLRRVIEEIEERRGKPLPMDVEKLKGGRPSTMERENIVDWLKE